MDFLKTWVLIGWGWIKWGAEKVWASLKLVAGTPSVWLACATFFVVGFMTGHFEGRRPAKPLMEEVQSLKAANATLGNVVKQERQIAQESRAEVARLQALLKDKPAPAANVAPAKAAPKTEPTFKLKKDTSKIGDWNPFN